MKKIIYEVKSVSANTEYREVSKEDKKWVLDQCQRISTLADDCVKSVNSDLRSIGNELTKPDKELIRQGSGHLNSVKTLVDGVITNMVKGSQRDFSNRTCKGLDGAFKKASEIFNTVEEVEWVKGELNTVQAMDPQQGTTLSDLFDTQVYEVTVKRIK
jgi:hypothetical protein